MSGMISATQFKQAIAPGHDWFVYLITLAALITLAVFLAKKSRTLLDTQSCCLIIDKKQLGAKTTLYILEYQNQRVLLADNQQALALQVLTKEN